MHVDAALVIEIAALLTAVLALGTTAIKIIRWVQKQEQQSKDIKEINDEQRVMMKALFACLDGLKQLKCNGEVTKAHDLLEQHLNDRAHDSKKQ